MNLQDLDATDNAALKDIIRDRIRREGPITFADYLRLVLYHPQEGYYFTQNPALDYETSPQVHPVFGAMVARQLADFWRLLGRPARFDVFEAGAGNGHLARDVLRALSLEEPALYEAVHYVVQEIVPSPLRPPPPGLPQEKVAFATEMPGEASVEGCILSNELLDALPFHRVRRREGHLWELRVDFQRGRFVEVEALPGREIRDYFLALGLEPGEGCEAEVNLEAPAWIRRAAAALRRGYLLTLDYGYEAADLYAPWRKRGTLLTFYRHTAGEDPYARIGHQDITASVDFTTVARAGEEAGLRTLGLVTQADFLAALGIGELLAQQPAADQMEAYYALRRAVLELTDVWGLGRIRVLFQGRDVPKELPHGLATAKRA